MAHSSPLSRLFNPATMAPTRKELLEAVYLELGKFNNLVLVGEPGAGKTLMAKMLCSRVITDRVGIRFEVVIWIYIKPKDEACNKDRLNKLVKRQLHMLYMTEKLEAEGDKEAEKEKDEKEEQHSEVSDTKEVEGGNKEEKQERSEASDANLEKEKMEEHQKSEDQKNEERKTFEKVKMDEEKEKMEKEHRQILKNKNVLFVFDGHVEIGIIREVLEEFNDLDQGNDKDQPDVKRRFLLITEVDDKKDTYTKLENLTDDDVKICSNTMLKAPDKLNKMWVQFGYSRKVLPMDIIILEKVHSFLNGSDEELENLKLDIEEMPQSENSNKSMQLLYKGYNPLPGNVIIDFCLGTNVFLKQGSLHFNELIAYWILEGYLGDFDRIEDAYKKGHTVILDLLDCGLLKETGYGYVVANEAKLIPDPLDCYEFSRRTHLGLRTVFGERFYRMGVSKGSMKTLHDGIEPDKPSSLALILDANSLDRETHIDYKKLNEQHEIFACFDPTDEYLPTLLFQKSKVRLFVLRGGSYIESAYKEDNSPEALAKTGEKPIVKQMQPFATPTKATNTPSPSIPIPDPMLSKLTVLEISGASLLDSIPDTLFSNMPKVKSLNLSGLGISSLPSTLDTLKDLVLLILQKCSKLKEVGTLENAEGLQVLDLSGAEAFTRFHDKSFKKNIELRTLNLSGTNVYKVPILHDLTSLNHLLLKGCGQLKRLPKISALTSLEILDLSGSGMFEEFHDASLELLVKLKLVNLSRTAVRKLPLNFANPQVLNLSGCQKLKKLSFIKSMERLSVLDLSNCSEMASIYPPFFEKLSSLQDMNLSATKVQTIPSFSEFKNLRKLKICNSNFLEKLEGLESLESLEYLDLSDSTNLRELDSLDKLSKLKELNLSKTRISSLPSFPGNSNLQILTLTDCTELKFVESLQVLSKLEKLDLSGSVSLTAMEENLLENLTQLRDLNLSGTRLRKSPSLSKLQRMEILCFRNCKEMSEFPGLDQLTQLQQLNLSGSAVSNIPFEKFSNLQYLGLENCPNLVKFSIDEFSKPGSDGFLFKSSSFPEMKLLEPTLVEQGQHSNLESASEIEPHDNKWRVSCWFPGKALRISMGPAQFVRHESLLREKSKEFHVAYYPAAVEATYGDELIRKSELRFRECYTAALLKEPNQYFRGSLEIMGKLNSFPMELTSEIHHFKRVFLLSVEHLKNSKITENAKDMEVFWVEKCDKLEGEATDDNTSDNKGRAGGSDVQKKAASSSASEFVLSNIIINTSFQNLKFMYLEHCEELNYIGGSSGFLNNLEILQIKNCKALKKLFKEVAELPNLTRLQLWALPELAEISCNMPLLSTLDVGECPQLKYIFSSASPVEKIEVLRVRFCAKLEKICVDQEPKLGELQALHLWDLPELVSIGQTLVQPPKCYIRGCPKLIQKL